jgi:hypothetical protein
MDFIIKRKVFISMLFIGLTMLGYVSYKKLAVELFPNAQLPTLIVQVGSPDRNGAKLSARIVSVTGQWPEAISAWGNAPGFQTKPTARAESPVHGSYSE